MVGSDMRISGSQSPLQQPSSKAGAETILGAEGLHNQHEASFSHLGHYLFIHHIESALVNKADTDTLLLQPLHSIQAPVKRVTVTYNVALCPLSHHIIFSRPKGVAFAVQLFAVRTFQNGKRRASRENEPQTRLPEDRFHASLELQSIGWEVQFGVVAIFQPIVREEVVDSEVASVVCHVVAAAVAEMAEQVTVVQAGHRQLRAAHLQKRGERAVDALFAFLHAEASCGRDVPPLHDPTSDEDIFVVLVDRVETCRALQVVVDNSHALLLVRRVHPGQNIAHHLPKLLAVGYLLARAQVGAVRVFALLDRLQVGSGLGVSALLQVGYSVLDGDGVVAVCGALHTINSWHHLPLDHHCRRPFCHHHPSDGSVQGVQVFTVALGNPQPVPSQGVLNAVALHVGGRVACNGDVVVIDQKFDIQVLCHCQTSCLRIVPLHLTAITAKDYADLARVGHSNTVDIGPHVPKPSRTKLHARSQPKFRMAGQFGVTLAVVD
mmetsp:Transcript_31589/g.61635  ORF Transcript_31589/g.61635 Transcript_31589/m.61635 type:complete len:493 (-) Transcript_31589:378-1856(-)